MCTVILVKLIIYYNYNAVWNLRESHVLDEILASQPYTTISVLARCGEKW